MAHSLPSPLTDAEAAHHLQQLLLQAGAAPLSAEPTEAFIQYLRLLQKWNARTNLTAIRGEEEILARHFVESILCETYLPINSVSLLDFGSGAGFPGIPIAIIRKDLSVTLAESQNKKASFLREAARTLSLSTKVHGGRAEDLKGKFDCVTLRAVDHMTEAVSAAIDLLKIGGTLAIMTTTTSLAVSDRWKETMEWQPPIPLPRGTERILLLATKSG